MPLFKFGTPFYNMFSIPFHDWGSHLGQLLLRCWSWVLIFDTEYVLAPLLHSWAKVIIYSLVPIATLSIPLFKPSKPSLKITCMCCYYL